MERETVIVTLAHRKLDVVENRYESPKEFYRQELSMQWIDTNNPELVRKIIAVVNNFKSKEI